MLEKHLVITVDKTEDTEDRLKSLGYIKRSGSAAYDRDKIAIVPTKLWYWLETGNTGTRFENL